MDEQLVSHLYELAPEEFVAAREALAKRLVAEGDRAAAKEVRALRRPTVVAWAANQLVRREPGAVRALLEAGERLREAQEGALGGAGGTRLREAMGERRSALDALVRRGVELLGDRAGAARNELSATLLAASSDPVVGEELERGRLTREVDAASGFEAFEVKSQPVAASSDRGEPPAAERALAEARGRARGAAERRESAEAALAEAMEEAKVASAEAVALERALARARASLADAESKVSSLTATADDVRREAADAEAEVKRAEAGS